LQDPMRHRKPHELPLLASGPRAQNQTRSDKEKAAKGAGGTVITTPRTKLDFLLLARSPAPATKNRGDE
jgi:hypothetical protein